MASRAHDARSSLFTVRVWPEEADGGRVEWRGKVQRVLSGETLYFRDWDMMLAFLMAPADSPRVSETEQQGDIR